MILAPVTDGQFDGLRLRCLKARGPALPAEIDVLVCGRPALAGAEVVRGPIETRVAEQALKRGHLQFPHYSGLTSAGPGTHTAGRHLPSPAVGAGFGRS